MTRGVDRSLGETGRRGGIVSGAQPRFLEDVCHVGGCVRLAGAQSWKSCGSVPRLAG
jgi:hypothetical protein